MPSTIVALAGIIEQEDSHVVTDDSIADILATRAPANPANVFRLRLSFRRSRALRAAGASGEKRTTAKNKTEVVAR